MEESLKAARVIHQIVIIASTAMLIFAMSSRSPENEYTRALRELRALEANLAEIDRLRRLDFERVNRPFLEYIRNSTNREVQFEFEKSVEFSYEKESLRALRALIADVVEKSGSKVVFDPVELKPAADAFAAADPCYNPQIELVGAPRIWNVEWRCNLEIVANFEVDVTPTTHAAQASSLLEKVGLVAYDPSPDPRPTDLAANVFPALQQVWDAVKEAPAGAAASELDRRARESARSPKLSVLGLEMQATTAIVAGPGILIALLLYLYAHLLHIQAIARSNEALLRQFPWLPLFDSRLSAGLTASTLWLLPSVAAVWTVWVAGLPMNYRIPLVLGYVAGIGAVAFASIRRAQELNQLGDSSQPAEQAGAETATATAPAQNPEMLQGQGIQTRI